MFSFANPIFLWGLLGLAAPVLIHLINRDLFRPLHFPSLRFIFRGTLPVERKRRIRDWLLLLLRLLLFAAIIGALARPEWQSTAATAIDESDSELVLLVDASASMSGWNSAENVLAKIDELFTEHDPSRAALVISANGPQTIEPLTTDRARLRSLLTENQAQPVAGDHRESFRQALRLFSENNSQTLAIISDFQQSDWSPSALPEIPAHIETVWVDVAETDRQNGAILYARALPLPDGGRQIVAEIRNFGSSEASRTLTLSVSDQTLEREISLAPGETRSVSFILDENIASKAELFLDSDGFPFDDRYFIWLERPPAIPVLLVAPTSQEPEKLEELFFLTRALSTQTETEWLHFAVQTLEPADLTAAALRNAASVFLLGAAPYLDETKWALLHEYLANGGRLLFTPGNAPARQTTLLSQQNLLNLQFSGMAGIDHRRPRPHHIESILPDSSIDLLFQGNTGQTLSHVSFFRYTRLQPDDTDAEILLRTSGDDPLLIRRNIGAGTVFATAFPFETAWTDLPLSTAFLPIIRDLVAGDLPPDHGIAHFETGSGSSEIAAQLNLAENAPVLAQIDPMKPGIELVGNVPLIFNAPRSESVLTQTSPADLQTAVTPRVSENQPLATGRSETSGTLILWPWLAATAFLLFIIEMPLAAYLRRTRTAETRPVVGATSQPS